MKADATSTVPCLLSSLSFLHVPGQNLALLQVSWLGSDLKHARLEEVTGEKMVLLQVAFSLLAWFLDMQCQHSAFICSTSHCMQAEQLQ